jgi:hypothetical protein
MNIEGPKKNNDAEAGLTSEIESEIKALQQKVVALWMEINKLNSSEINRSPEWYENDKRLKTEISEAQHTLNMLQRQKRQAFHAFNHVEETGGLVN